MKRLVVDIDNTLLKCDYINGKYINPKLILEEITHINRLYKSGYIIILWSGRSWVHYEDTVNQLKKYEIPYHELILGKPLGIYVDKDSLTTLRDIK